jgi:Ca2+-binding RTX toxin-like protein
MPTGSVTIVGSAIENQSLKIKNTLEDVDGLGAIKYQWLRDGENISNASQSSYTLTSMDVGKKISVKAYYTDLLGTAESVNSIEVVPTVTVNHAPTGTAIIKGLATWGATLAITNTIKDFDGMGKLSYTWQNDNGQLSTNASYTLAETDIGKKIWAIVSYTDKKGNFEKVKSNVVDVTVSNKPSSFNDMLIGTANSDKLSGLSGNDTLIGGLGKDSLTGGVGIDIFKFTSINDSPALPKKADIITDFKHTQGDKIDLSDIDINPTLDGKQSFIPLNAQTFSADATGQLRFDTKTSTLYGSINSDPAPEFAIVLSGVKILMVDDFIF